MLQKMRVDKREAEQIEEDRRLMAEGGRTQRDIKSPGP